MTHPATAPRPVVIGLASHVQREKDRRHKRHAAVVDATENRLDPRVGVPRFFVPRVGVTDPSGGSDIDRVGVDRRNGDC